MLDLEPATRRLSEVVVAVRDDQLGAPTPCTETTLGAMLDHVDGLSQAFTAAARKTPPERGSQAPSADGSRLRDGWRTRIPEQLATLADAWREPAAWTGMTEAGGVALPGEVAALVALNEVIVHGWDIAVASGQPYSCDDELVEGALGFVRPTVAESPDGTPGLFGPPVRVPDDAPMLDQLLGLTGRDPAWREGARVG